MTPKGNVRSLVSEKTSAPSLLKRIPLPQTLLAAGLLLLAVQIARGAGAVLQVMKAGEGEERLSLQVASLRHVLAEGIEDPVSHANLAIPYEDHPGALLADLSALMRGAGIASFRYKAVKASGDAWGTEADAETDWILPPEGAVADEEENDLPAETVLEGLDLEMPAGDADLLEWRIPLRLEASYAEVLAFLRNLRGSGRIWNMPHLSIEEADGGRVAADVLLVTWTHPGDGEDTGSSGDGNEAADDGATVPSLDVAESREAARDPFRLAAPAASPAGEAPPPLPRLGAIRSGGVPSALLNGRYAREGDVVDSWTVVKIEGARVVLRNGVGSIRHLEVEPDIEK